MLYINQGKKKRVAKNCPCTAILKPKRSQQINGKEKSKGLVQEARGSGLGVLM
jgi:hypothetical protein